MRILSLLILLSAGLVAQRRSDRDLHKIARRYLAAERIDIPAMDRMIAELPPLSKNDAKKWVAKLKKLLTKGGPKLKTKGTGYFYDKRSKRGKYIVSGGGNRRGLVIGLHGGGVGSADCGGAASSFRGAIQNCGMIGLFPQAIEATEAAWGDRVTVRFILDLLAAARRSFRFNPDRVYVVGHSMGGYGAWTWGGRFTDRLAGTASFAGSPTPLWDSHKKIVGIQSGVLPSYYSLPLWVYHSADDPRVPIDVPRYAIKELRGLKKEYPGGFDFRYQEVDRRGHAFPKKGPLPGLRWITKHKRQPRPRKLIWQAFYERRERRYWVEWTQPTRGSQVVASWDGKSSFDISGDADPTELAILLDDGMCDLDRPITLSFDGKKLRSAVPQRSFLTLLRSARSRRDPGLLFTARVPLKAAP